MSAPPIILVPGFWLGAWAWAEVAADLHAAGHDVTPLTLPGLDSPDTDRSTITFEDHVDAICAEIARAAVPVVLVVHSGAGFSGYAASDRLPEQLAAMIYIDSAPGVGALNPDLTGPELVPPSPEELAQEENLEGLSEEQLAEFGLRAVPQPAGTVREGAELHNDARLDVPSTVICTGMSRAQYQAALEAGYGFVAGLQDLRDVSYTELPTSHWPMWSRPRELAALIGDIANSAG